jgi:hypothetical protein
MERRCSLGGRAVLVLALAGAMAAGAGRDPAVALPGARVGQPAPEITGGPWLNSEPLSLAGLRGRVVFVEFWTYG